MPEPLPRPPPAPRIPQSPAPAPHAANPLLPRPGTVLGLGLARVRVELEAPRQKVTDRETDRVSGRVFGGPAGGVSLHVNGVETAVELKERGFRAAVSLRPGLNSIRAVVAGPGGAEAEDAVTVEYVPPLPADGILLASPRDGLTLGADDPPAVVVEGRLGDPAATAVWLVANDRRVQVAAAGGRFRHVVPVLEPAVRIWAELDSPNGAPPPRSEAVTVHAGAVRPAAGVLVMDWVSDPEAVEVTASWRGSPERLDVAPVPVSLRPLGGERDRRPAAFYLGNLRPGIYTFAVRARGAGARAGVHSTLYLGNGGAVQQRTLAPVSLGPGERVVLARVLHPHGVFWDEDAWFTGRSESAEAITKFRFPEGVTWVERKADVQ
ncbi:MAG TPA: hypothetical protein VMT79_03530 [Candidatus Binatia bacterium]|nr:hypothetical protein [Candidatus Binatia bacterium]